MPAGSGSVKTQLPDPAVLNGSKHPTHGRDLRSTPGGRIRVPGRAGCRKAPPSSAGGARAALDMHAGEPPSASYAPPCAPPARVSL